jgi:F-type H+-transporting ATPase subunit b
VRSLEKRADLIDKGVEYAQDAKAQLDNARAEAQKYISEAQKQQAEILRDAAKMKTQIIEEARREASDEAKKVMDAAKLSIEQSRKEAELQFRNEVSKFSIDIAEKMVRKQMSSDSAQSELVNKLLDEIEKN